MENKQQQSESASHLVVVLETNDQIQTGHGEGPARRCWNSTLHPRRVFEYVSERRLDCDGLRFCLGWVTLRTMLSTPVITATGRIPRVRCAKGEKTVISGRTAPVVQESRGSRLEPKTQKLLEVFEAPWTDPLQLEAIHNRLWDTVHPLLPALSDEFRLWSLFIRLGVDVTLVEDILAMKVSELRPTAIAVIVVPIIAWSVVPDESKSAPLQPLQAIESPVG